MPKIQIPDFSKIVDSVKAILNPEGGTPKVEEGDPIGAKIVKISTLLQNTASAQAQSAKDLTQINHLLDELYKELAFFRKQEAELHQRQQAEAQVAPSPTAKKSPIPKPEEAAKRSKPPLKEVNVKEEEKGMKKGDQSPLHPNEGTSAPTDKD